MTDIDYFKKLDEMNLNANDGLTLRLHHIIRKSISNNDKYSKWYLKIRKELNNG